MSDVILKSTQISLDSVALFSLSPTFINSTAELFSANFISQMEVFKDRRDELLHSSSNIQVHLWSTNHVSVVL